MSAPVREQDCQGVKEGEAGGAPKRSKQEAMTSKIAEGAISIQKMASNEYEGWRITLNEKICGHVKFHPKSDEVFKEHVTVDFKVSKKQQGKHIGRIALKQAIIASVHTVFVAHLKKSNIASNKALTAVGFTEHKYPEGNQQCMAYTKV